MRPVPDAELQPSGGDRQPARGVGRLRAIRTGNELETLERGRPGIVDDVVAHLEDPLVDLQFAPPVLGRGGRGSELDDDIGRAALFQPHDPSFAIAAGGVEHEEEVRPAKIPFAGLDLAEVDEHVAAAVEVVAGLPVVVEGVDEQVHLLAVPGAFHGFTVVCEQFVFARGLDLGQPRVLAHLGGIAHGPTSRQAEGYHRPRERAKRPSGRAGRRPCQGLGATGSRSPR